MKICFLINSLNYGGAERFTTELCNYWDREHDVTLVTTFGEKGNLDFELSDSIKVLDFCDSKYVCFKFFGKLLWMRSIFRSEFDVVVSFLPNVNILNVLASKGFKHKVIISERTNPFAMKYSAILRALTTFLYPKADKLVVQTEALKLQYEQYNRNFTNIEVIPNYLSEQLQCMEVINPAKSVRNLIVVGRIEVGKQCDKLVDVFYEIQKKYKDISLYFIGDGSEKSKVVERAKQLGIANRVFVKGFSQNPWSEVPLDSSIYLSASQFEGFPNALLEALSLGVPSVVFNCPSGPKELTNNGVHGGLVELNDFAAFQQNIFSMINSYTKRLQYSRESANFVRSNFAPSVVQEKWNNIVLK